MAVRRTAGAWIGSALVHGVLLAVALSQEAPAAVPAVESPIEIEVVELSSFPSPSSRLAERTANTGAGPAIATSTPPPPPRLVVATRERPKPRPAPPAIPTPPDPAPDPEPLPAGPVPSSGPPEDSEPSPASPIESLARPTSFAPRSGDGGYGSGAGFGGDDDAYDHSAYGAEIVRILKAELDRHPVPGISPRDSLQLVLTVLPNGELAWLRDGRFGFAEVVNSSLGPLRLRQVLKRIQIASARFPAHPQGLTRRHYVVDVTFRFSTPKR